MALSKTTTDHDEIRQWAEARGAVPAEVSSTGKGGQTGILRFEFPNAPKHNDGKLQEISWDEFFQKFDENNLELVYQEKTADGEESNFNKLVHPESEERSGSKAGGKSQAKSGSKSQGKSQAASKNGGGTKSKTASKSAANGAGAGATASGTKGGTKKAASKKAASKKGSK